MGGKSAELNGKLLKKLLISASTDKLPPHAP